MTRLSLSSLRYISVTARPPYLCVVHVCCVEHHTHLLPHSTPHLTTPSHHTIPHLTTPHHTTPHHTTPHHTTPHLTTPHHTTPHHTTPTSPHHTTLSLCLTFQAVVADDLAAVRSILDAKTDTTSLCHPLCVCAQCTELLIRFVSLCILCTRLLRVAAKSGC